MTLTNYFVFEFYYKCKCSGKYVHNLFNELKAPLHGIYFMQVSHTIQIVSNTYAHKIISAFKNYPFSDGSQNILKFDIHYYECAQRH